MAGGMGTLSLISIPNNCKAQTYNETSMSWADTSLPIAVGGGGSGTLVRIIDGNGQNITKICEPTCDVGTVSETRIYKHVDYSGMGIILGGYHFCLRGGDVDEKISIILPDSSDSSNSIGNIPMGELTFNGVQSVTYNGTNYTKLVVDGTSYPPPPPPVTIISFTISETSYQAEEGMTWAEWVDSEYNISSRYSLSGTHIFYGRKAVYKTSTSVPVEASEVIENTSYFEMGGPLPPE